MLNIKDNYTTKPQSLIALIVCYSLKSMFCWQCILHQIIPFYLCCVGFRFNLSSQLVLVSPVCLVVLSDIRGAWHQFLSSIVRRILLLRVCEILCISPPCLSHCGRPFFWPGLLSILCKGFRLRIVLCTRRSRAICCDPQILSWVNCGYLRFCPLCTKNRNHG